MLGEEQGIISNPNPDRLPPQPSTTDSISSPYPAGATDQHTGGSGTSTNISTVMNPGGNSGFVTQHLVNDVTVTTWQQQQPQNIFRIKCEVCNITCNNEAAFKNHNVGKKHLKNLQKIAITSLIAPNMPLPILTGVDPTLGVLENKKHKLLQHGAAVDKLLYCEICNVVCNNQEVFGKHLAGKKHISKATGQIANVNTSLNHRPEFAPVAQPPIPIHGSQKKPDLVLQPASCQICNISCTSNEGLAIHLAGKKHLKKLLETETMTEPSLIPKENPVSAEGKSVISQQVNSSWCEVCGISCDTPEVLQKHSLGKKHQKKLEESKTQIPVTEGKTVNLDGNNRKGKRVENEEDLEVKKRKIVESGAASGAVRTCTLCNVVCNSASVFMSHLAGQKHAAMAVKQAEIKASGQAI